MDAADDACGEWLTEDNEGRKRGCESISHSSRMWASARRISQKQAHAFASLLAPFFFIFIFKKIKISKIYDRSKKFKK